MHEEQISQQTNDQELLGLVLLIGETCRIIVLSMLSLHLQ